MAPFLDGAEGAGSPAGTAFHTDVLVDFRFFILAGMEGMDLAGIFTGTGDFHHSAVGAGPFAVAAFNAHVIVDMGAALVYGNGFLGAAVHAPVGQAAAAHIGDHVFVHWAGRAGFRQHSDHVLGPVHRFRGGLVGGIDDVHVFVDTQGHTDPFLQHRPFLVHAAPGPGGVFVDDLQHVIHMIRQVPVIGHL